MAKTYRLQALHQNGDCVSTWETIPGMESDMPHYYTYLIKIYTVLIAAAKYSRAVAGYRITNDFGGVYDQWDSRAREYSPITERRTQ